jgi:hypothetical protein
MNAVEVDVKSIDSDLKGLDTNVNNFKMMIDHKLDNLGTKIENSQKEMTHLINLGNEKLTGKFETTQANIQHAQQRQFNQFYYRSFFGVSVHLRIIHRILTRPRSSLSQSC